MSGCIVADEFGSITIDENIKAPADCEIRLQDERTCLPIKMKIWNTTLTNKFQDGEPIPTNGMAPKRKCIADVGGWHGFPYSSRYRRCFTPTGKNGIFGYTRVPYDSYYEAVTGWFARRHGWTIDREWIIYTSGVVHGHLGSHQGFDRSGR